MLHPGQSSAIHGGRAFEALGDSFEMLERHSEIVNADVLDAWFDPSPRVLARLREFLPFLVRTSPPVQARGMIGAIAQARGIPENCILAGGGSSDLIFQCLPRSPLQSGLIVEPAYGEYRHLLQNVLGIPIASFPLHKEQCFRIDTQRFIAAVNTCKPGLVAVVNPNNPTGALWPRTEALRFLDAIPESTEVIVDESYIDYASPDESLEREACLRPNLIVIKSMSKVYALSGLRVGYLVTHRATVRGLAPWMPPWAVSLPAQLAAIEALADPTYYRQKYSETHALRATLLADLTRIPGVTVYPSTTNALLTELETSAERTVDYLRNAGIFIRNCDSMSAHFKDHFIRIAVKGEPQNRRIAEALAAAV
jgi:histidinol-phosphate/aromatic aminotransferase/cobyric acid decarboxylase-like protein